MQRLMRVVAIAGLLACVLAARPAVAGSGFNVVGSRIIGPNGSPFVIRGVNVAGSNAAFPHKVTDWTHLIADVWKFNTVRVDCNIVPKGGTFHDNDNLDAIVRSFTQHRPNKVVVIFESHDLTGDFYGPDNHRQPSLGQLCAWYRGLATKYKNNPYVWFNVTNEPGPLFHNEQKWFAEHKAAIVAIRSTGNLSPILCDAAYWGQDINNDHFDRNDSAILTLGPKLVHLKNVAFSVHFYTEWTRLKDITTGMKQFFAATHQEKLAVIVGEWAWYSWDDKTHSRIDVSRAPKAFFTFGPQQGIGRIYWSWFGSDNPLCVQKPGPGQFPGQARPDPVIPNWTYTGGGWEIDRVDGKRPSNLTPAGQVAWADTHR